MPGPDRFDDLRHVLDANSPIDEVLWLHQKDRPLVTAVEAARLTTASHSLGKPSCRQLALELGEQFERAAALTRWPRRLVRTPVIADKQVVFTSRHLGIIRDRWAKRQGGIRYSRAAQIRPRKPATTQDPGALRG